MLVGPQGPGPQKQTWASGWLSTWRSFLCPLTPAGAAPTAEDVAESSRRLIHISGRVGFHGEARNQTTRQGQQVLSGGDTADSRVIHSLQELPGPKGD